MCVTRNLETKIKNMLFGPVPYPFTFKVVKFNEMDDFKWVKLFFMRFVFL